MASASAVLLKTLVQDFGHGYGFGSMSCSVYDTSWVSCVSKPSGVEFGQWLFPSSFRFVLNAQHVDGGWHWPPHETQDRADSTILSSLAAIFAITNHVKHPYQLVRLQEEANDRLKRGTEFLARVLKCLGPPSGYSVGFEVLVASLLELLEKEGIVFHFSGKRNLFQRRDAKLSKVPIRYLDRLPSTMLHSLEALYGDMDFSFDPLRNRTVCGSIMASPAATAAYLMRCSEWDDSAEAYLRLTISNGAGHDSGGVPSAFPSTNFELIWVASTLLKSGCITGDNLTRDGVQILDIFEKQFPENGLVGFAPGIQPDLDDSANASIVLSLLGSRGLSRQMREQFETKTHFETYKSESIDSLSANCSILMALLLDLKYDSTAVPAIEKVSKYLASRCYNTNGPIKDKWNVSEYYSIMLLAQAFMKLIRSWEACELAALSEDLLHREIIPAAFRSLLRILLTQGSNGSWGVIGRREETAYAILALLELAALPIASLFNQQLQSAILRGREYLKLHRSAPETEYLWVEKVHYGARNLSNAYIVAALDAPGFPPLEGHRIRRLVNLDHQAMAKFADILQSVPLLATQPRWIILASWIESQLFLPMLHEVRGAVFRRAKITKDKYFAWIPVLWTLANNINGCKTSARLLFDMMRVSVLNFQADEFMESVLDAGHGEDPSMVRQTIEGLFKNNVLPNETKLLSGSGDTFSQRQYTASANGIHLTDKFEFPEIVSASKRNAHHAFNAGGDQNDTYPSASHSSTTQSLQSFASYITSLITDANVSTANQLQVQAALKVFLHAHLTQTQMNRDFSAQKRTATSPSTAPLFIHRYSATLSFRTWLHKTAAVHTSCPYSFTLYQALVDAQHGTSLLRTSHQQYVADDLGGHLSRMCRLYNDCGSLKRDLAEGNLSCVNFSDFREVYDEKDEDCEGGYEEKSGDSEAAELSEGKANGSALGDRTTKDEEVERKLKGKLIKLADWERKGLEGAMEELATFSSSQTEEGKLMMNALKVFVDVTDLFGQVYVVKDLANTKI